MHYFEKRKKVFEYVFPMNLNNTFNSISIDCLDVLCVHKAPKKGRQTKSSSEAPGKIMIN